jgi:hypothetical protein
VNIEIGAHYLRWKISTFFAGFGLSSVNFATKLIVLPMSFRSSSALFWRNHSQANWGHRKNGLLRED